VNHFVIFNNPGSKAAWSCWGLNPGPADSQPGPLSHAAPNQNKNYRLKFDLIKGKTLNVIL